MTENCKLRKAILSAFQHFNNCDEIFVQTCLDQNFSYKVKGPLSSLIFADFRFRASCAETESMRDSSVANRMIFNILIRDHAG